jgi:uncharacterized protein
MRGTARRLKQLESELLALGEEAMLIEELDGFAAGLLVCPEMIKPGEWLPVIWGREEGSDAAVFENLGHANKVLGLVMDYYNDIARTLFEKPERYAPALAADMHSGEVLWELWIEGFEKAVKLRPAAWNKLIPADDQTAKAISGLLTLGDIARRDSRFSRAQIDALTATGHEKIAGWIVTLNTWRLANHKQMDFAASPASSRPPTGKVGRNDPCPCGSGKKYKKCCGLN